MSTELLSNQIEAPIRFDVTDAKISQLRKELAGLKAGDPEGYKLVVAGIAVTRTLRVAVEKTRKSLKEKALAYERLVDGEAKRITALLEAIEEPLKKEKQIADDAKELAKLAAAKAKQKELKDRLDSLAKYGCMMNHLDVQEMNQEHFESTLQIAMEEYLDRKDAERKEAERKKTEEAAREEAHRVEQEKLAVERAELARLRAEDEARKAVERAEQAKRDEENRLAREEVEAAKREIEAEKERIAREEQERLRDIRQAQEHAKAKAAADEQDRLDAIEKAEQLEALKPDVEKIRAFGEMLKRISFPKMSTEDGERFIESIEDDIGNMAEACEGFCK